MVRLSMPSLLLAEEFSKNRENIKIFRAKKRGRREEPDETPCLSGRRSLFFLGAGHCHSLSCSPKGGQA